MINSVLADAVLLLHFVFVSFVIAGGLLVLRWPRLAWLHLPAAAWGALVELAGWICPLTPLENEFRARAGRTGYSGGFVEHYLMPLIYPSGLTAKTQLLLGVGVIAVNLAFYGVLLVRAGRQRVLPLSSGWFRCIFRAAGNRRRLRREETEK
jgi:hypothetical protein